MIAAITVACSVIAGAVFAWVRGGRRPHHQLTIDAWHSVVVLE